MRIHSHSKRISKLSTSFFVAGLLLVGAASGASAESYPTWHEHGLAQRGYYGTPYGGGPQYGNGGGDQYGYGPGYSYARRVQPMTATRRRSDFGFWWLSFNDKRGLAGCCLSSNHSVRLPDGATLIAVPFQAFIGDLRPELFQLRRCRLVSVTFRIISSPGHLGGSSFDALKRKRVLSDLGSGNCFQ
jgi:hypothetical protein